MRILFLAPNPFFQERGTPLAIRLLLETLAEQGHRIDVLTYHEGEDPGLPDAVRIVRIPAPPFVRNVPIGFSLKKIVCDFFMAMKMCALLWRERYDVVHAVEESVYFALAARWALGLPYVYDMDSSLAAQLVEAKPKLASISPFLRYLERIALRGSSAIVPMCDVLADDAAKMAPGKPVVVLEDIPMGEAGVEAASLREQFGIGGKFALYVGNLQEYQGIRLMIDSFAEVLRDGGDADLVVVGGRADHIEYYREHASDVGIGDRVHWAGPRPVAELPSLLGQADILLSPRLHGVNTPMKIYSYLAAGVPTVATSILSHTQVLDESVAALAPPKPGPYGHAILHLLKNPAEAALMGRRARQLAEDKYSRPAFDKKVANLYAALTA